MGSALLSGYDQDHLDAGFQSQNMGNSPSFVSSPFEEGPRAFDELGRQSDGHGDKPRRPSHRQNSRVCHRDRSGPLVVDSGRVDPCPHCHRRYESGDQLRSESLILLYCSNLTSDPRKHFIDPKRPCNRHRCQVAGCRHSFPFSHGLDRHMLRSMGRKELCTAVQIQHAVSHSIGSLIWRDTTRTNIEALRGREEFLHHLSQGFNQYWQPSLSTLTLFLKYGP